ncbi:MAG: D-alanyl-D-alanine carboxypeptidase [Treponema sp.]|nr:D-alanyl-D-alanine carboxypeptidase [Treponema sp.]
MYRKFILFILAFNLQNILYAQYFTPSQLLYPYTIYPPQIVSRSAIMIDAHTGTLLYSKNPDLEIPPASLTKLMTMHLVMNEIEAGRASLEEIVPLTVDSWAQRQPEGSSLMFLEPRQIVTLREIMLGMSISSGNDAAVAAALRFAPTMEEFAAMMTSEARRMGLHVTRFVESSGISELNVTNAEEYAHFCRQYLELHPQSLNDFHSVEVFYYPMAHNVPEHLRRNLITYTHYNRNNLLRIFSGTDGLKTGFIDESGYNIAVTAQRDQTRIIAVLMGAPSQRGGDRIRDADTERLLTWAFENFKTIRPEIDPIENPRLWKGREKTVKLVFSEPPDFTSPIDRAEKLFFTTFIPNPLIAPLQAGYTAGYYIISDELGELRRIPLITAEAYERGNIFRRIWHSFLLLFNKNK